MADFIQALIDYTSDFYRRHSTPFNVAGGVVAGTVGTLMVSRLFVDSYYFINMTYEVTRSVLFGKKNIGLLDEVVLSSTVHTTDLDHMFHMNNSRYNREADFGRHALLIKLGFYNAMQLIKKERGVGKSFGLAATTIRFRRSLELFDRYCLKTRLVFWDDKSLYLEQKFERKKDKFVMAIMYAKLQLVGITSSEFIEKLGYGGVDCPEPPADLVHWLKYNEESSKALRPSHL